MGSVICIRDSSFPSRAGETDFNRLRGGEREREREREREAGGAYADCVRRSPSNYNCLFESEVPLISMNGLYILAL